MLPGMTGYELARYLRQDERHATLPVMFLTTQGNIEARIELRQIGRRRSSCQAGAAQKCLASLHRIRTS